MMKSKYKLGDIVYLEKIFTPKNGGRIIEPKKTIYAKVIRIEDTASLGIAYELKPLCETYLGGVLYWEKDIGGLASLAFEEEEKMWRVWGDQ